MVPGAPGNRDVTAGEGRGEAAPQRGVPAIHSSGSSSQPVRFSAAGTGVVVGAFRWVDALHRREKVVAFALFGTEVVSDKKPRSPAPGTPPPPPLPPPPPPPPLLAPPAMTSGNESESPAVTACAPHNGENKPPQAIVKPQVLTHVIEGFVIQEGAEPFPVCVERLPILIHSPKKSDHRLSDDPDKTPASNAANTDSEGDDVIQHDKDDEDEPKLTCEYCGWVDLAYKFKGSRRFCSVVCAKRYNVGCSKRMGLFRPGRSKPASHWRKRSQSRPIVEAKKRKSPPSPRQTQGGSVSSPHASQPSQDESTPCSDMSSYEEPPSPLSACEARDLDNGTPQHFLPCDPTKWNVEEVYEFIRSLQGCQEIADEFRSQEIDGQALLLLKEDHLMSTMNIKLGPALKIFPPCPCQTPRETLPKVALRRSRTSKCSSLRQGAHLKLSHPARMAEMMHEAFWDILRKQIESSPPMYHQVVSLLQEVKLMLQALLLPAHVSLRAQLEEVLDPGLIQQEAEHGALDLHGLAAFITSTMFTMCAPVRDPEIRALRSLTDPVEIFREVLRVLELMKMDMVNFSLRSLRPHLVQHAAQFERTKFQELLDKQPDSMDNTVAWLQMAAKEQQAAVPGPVICPSAVLNRAYIGLLRWDPQDHRYPETVLMDKARLDVLGQKVHILVLQVAVLLLSSAQCGGAVFSLLEFVGKVKQTSVALLKGSQTRESDLKGALKALGDQVVLQVNVALASLGVPRLSKRGQGVLRGQISDLWRPANPVRTIIEHQVQGFLQATLEASAARGSPEPPAILGPLGPELVALGAVFCRMVQLNRSAFGAHYAPVLGRLLFPPGGPEGAR
ncbi:hypothetical protein NHX12_029848 [Muraenolepis orangiensis]|uniref:Uncharacterized protein n=1 Tax=Muraenolepis orangiensis TaxID=630683 RepID=A0A9Q0EAM3_9TELE|nr:hypothetical protein NHX12_029848 [Muraenolepis orangiensis]